MKRNSKITIALVAILIIVTSVSFAAKARNATPPKNNEISAVKSPSTTNNTTCKDKKPDIIKYVIKSGDTLESIAKFYGVKVSTVAESNKLLESSILKVGQELVFPSVNGVLYKIKDGETLWDLASMYDIKINDIVTINNIKSPDELKIGQQIIIPGIENLKVETEVAMASNATTKTTVSRGGSFPVSGQLSSNYGSRWGTKHKGIDIAASTGTNVYAFMAGTVVSAGWDDGGYGNLVIIDHGNGLQSYYAHNSKILVKEGQSISKGQHIAEVGSTGNSTGPHSHFEVRKNGVAVNPNDYLN